jgi:hypothetical protein
MSHFNKHLWAVFPLLTVLSYSPVELQKKHASRALASEIRASTENRSNHSEPPVETPRQEGSTPVVAAQDEPRVEAIPAPTPTHEAAPAPVAASAPEAAPAPEAASAPVAASAPEAAPAPVAASAPVAAPTPVAAPAPVAAPTPVAASAEVSVRQPVNGGPRVSNQAPDQESENRDRPKKDDRECADESRTRVLPTDVQSLVQQQNLVMQQMMTMSQLMVSMMQQMQIYQMQQQMGQLQNPVNQSAYQYTTQQAGNWVYHPQGFRPGMFPDQFGQMPQQQQQQPQQGYNGWGLNPQQTFQYDPRMTPMQPQPGQFGPSPAGLGFNMGQPAAVGMNPANPMTPMIQPMGPSSLI